jgi:membrane-associated phospholipid phosphatase
MQQELAEVKDTVDHLSREQLRVALHWNDGAGTYAPPGHWNDIAAEYVSNARFSEVRAARAFALLNIAMHDAAVGCWDAKYAYFNPRPSQLDRGIKTSIGLPNFPAYTSGHSTFSAAASAVLSYLFTSGAQSFEAMKDEAGISRLYGGIHYRADIDAGKEHGERIGAYTVSFARQDGADN